MSGLWRQFQIATRNPGIVSSWFAGTAPLWLGLIDGLLDYDDTARIHKITAPTRLLWGDQDSLFSRAEQDRFLASVPHAELIVYEETGHCPNWEVPERVA